MPKKQDTRKPKDEKARAVKPKGAKARTASSSGSVATAVEPPVTASAPVEPPPAETLARKTGPKKVEAAAPKPKARVKKAADDASAPGARKGKGRPKTTGIIEDVTAPIVKRAAATSTKIKKAVKSAKRAPVRIISDLPLPSLPTRVPHLPTPSLPHIPGLPHIDVAETAKSIGGQIMSVLNTSAGRLIAAEVLIHLATSLTKAAANTEAGQDATQTVLNAGAKIGAAVANAGAKVMEAGGEAAEAGAERVSETATTAKDVVREVAQVAVSTVGSVMVEAANKVIRSRGRPKRAEMPASAAPDPAPVEPKAPASNPSPTQSA